MRVAGIRARKERMSKRKDPPDYPGDEEIQKRLGELLHELRVKKGLSLEEVDAFVTQRTGAEGEGFVLRFVKSGGPV